jgi:hypothetical protein
MNGPFVSRTTATIRGLRGAATPQYQPREGFPAITMNARDAAAISA